MPRWGMVIDLNRCIGCEACTVACKAQNFVPGEVTWNRVFKAETGTYPDVTSAPFPVQCMHCDAAPCVQVCPTGATYRRADGIVYIDYNNCIGCRYCVIACPYGARTYVSSKKTYYPAGESVYEAFADTKLPQASSPASPLATRHQAGVVEKCIFCAQKIDAGIRKGLKPGADAGATPACVVSCVGEARVFGDLDDPDSEAAKLASSAGAFRYKESFGTQPKVYYLPLRKVS